MTDRHQTLMNQACDRWQKDRTMSKADFFDSLDADERFAVHTGNLTYQVQNGGFMQWRDNGYATPEAVGYLRHTLTRMGSPAATEVRKLLDQFASFTEACEDARRMDEDEWDELRAALDPLDIAFYDVDETFLAECESWLVSMMDGVAGADGADY